VTVAFPPPQVIRSPDEQRREAWVPAPSTQVERPVERYALQRTYEEFFRRQGVRGSGVAHGVLDTVRPSVTVGRDWQNEELDFWGVSSDQISGAGTTYPAIGIQAGDREVLVRRIDFMLSPFSRNDINVLAGQVHLTKALNRAVYDPVQGAGQFYPFLLTTRGFELPHCAVIAGTNAALPTVIIDDVLVAPAIGPRWQAPALISPSFVVGFFQISLNAAFQRLLEFDDPPIVVRPGEFLYLQGLQQSAPGITGVPESIRLWANWWFSERVQ